MEFKQDKLKWLEFDLLKPYLEISHGVFSRQGGTSKDPYATLNLSNEIGDHPDSVKVNREIIRKQLGVEVIIFPHQTHGENVAYIRSSQTSPIPQADALVTMERNIGIGVMHADCQAVLLYDPENGAIAAVHAGWKGSVKNILKEAVESLKVHAKSDPSHLLACISPSLGPDHAEYKNYKEDFPESFWDHQPTPNHFDFWAISRMQLLECGLRDQHIEAAKICTACTSEDYFSARRDKLTGRNATVIALR